MFASQKAASQWAPCHQTVFIFVKQWFILRFVLFSGEHIVLILTANRLVQIEFLAHLKSLKNCFCVPIACCPIKGLAVLNNLVKSSTYFFHRRSLIVHMSVDDIDVIHIEFLQRSIHWLFYVFFINCYRAVNFRVIWSVHFCSNNYRFSFYIQLS